MHSLLVSGTLGKCPDQLTSFEAKCRELYPVATAFKPIHEEIPAPQPPIAPASLENHLDGQTDKQAETINSENPSSQPTNEAIQCSSD